MYKIRTIYRMFYEYFSNYSEFFPVEYFTLFCPCGVVAPAPSGTASAEETRPAGAVRGKTRVIGRPRGVGRRSVGLEKYRRCRDPRPTRERDNKRMGSTSLTLLRRPTGRDATRRDTTGSGARGRARRDSRITM